ncbi:kelch-like protein 24 [Magallana gigas]|uniref:kelch-like protein 24 n=1 Tax=Magallana gigas TaxID=29159 RepID=UPI00333EC571
MSYSGDLADGLQKLRGNQKFCDMVLKAEDKEFYCHKVVLSALSVYFETMFDSSFKEKKESEVEMKLAPVQCETLLDFMYTGKSEWADVDDAIDMLHLSQQYQIRSLREQSLQYLYQHISSEYCVRMWEAAKFLELKELEEKTSTIISKEFALVSSTDEFLEINTLDFVIELLKKNDLNAQEETIAKAGLRWIEKDFEGRKDYCYDILEALQTRRSLLINLASEANFPNLHNSPEFKDALQRYRERGNVTSPGLDLEECVVVMGGNDRGSNQSLICFGFRHKKWFTLPPIPHDPEINFSICTSRCKLYVSGGFGNGQGFYEYDGERNAWRALPNLLSPRQNHCMAYSNGKVVLLGGTDPRNTLNFVNEIDVYDTTTNVWCEIRTTLQQAVRSSAYCVLESKVFLFGGLSERGEKVEKLQYFDIEKRYSVQDKWCTIPEVIRCQARALVVDRTIIVISLKGKLFQLKNDRGNYFFENKESMRYFPRKGFGVSPFDGRILIVGGEVNYAKTKDMLQHKLDDGFTFEMEQKMPFSSSNFCLGHMFVKRAHLSYECKDQVQIV